MAIEVVVADYGSGNIGSLMNMLKRMGLTAGLARTPEDILGAPRIVLPGVGSFDSAAKKLELTGIGEAVKEASNAGTPILGVCLGMQLLMDCSEEGTRPGLGLIPGFSQRLLETEGESELRIPHMGWNNVQLAKESRFFSSLGRPSRYYFVHSYKVVTENKNHVLGTTTYGNIFTSAVERENIVGVQFHPEKSHHDGGKLLLEFGKS